MSPFLSITVLANSQINCSGNIPWANFAGFSLHSVSSTTVKIASWVNDPAATLLIFFGIWALQVAPG